MRPIVMVATIAFTSPFSANRIAVSKAAARRVAKSVMTWLDKRRAKIDY